MEDKIYDLDGVGLAVVLFAAIERLGQLGRSAGYDPFLDRVKSDMSADFEEGLGWFEDLRNDLPS